MKSIKAIFRRGQKDGPNHQDNISRTSSITNLESPEAQRTSNKGAKPRKSASKERIDKIAEKEKKNDAKKGITRNNNQLDPEGNSYNVDSVHEEELLQLRRQLQDMANEKSNLALQLGEQKGQLAILQKEIQKLKAYQEDSNLELEKLAEENTALRNRLRDVAHSPLSDNEKQQLLFESRRHHSSAPASIATNVPEENGDDHTACTTPDWDKHSSSNVSEVSVACLQDKINQMQETHYSTNEELQATLQELADLQNQLVELQRENERLTEEKTLMFDSLCRQTERLTDARGEVDDLRHLLYHGKEEGAAGLETAVERERRLVDLLKSTQDEREAVLVKLEQVGADLQDARQDNISKSEHILQLAERVKTLECTLDAKHAEHKQIDQELAIAKDQCSGKQIEINRLSDLLENARTKIHELEQDRSVGDRSELDELLDAARKEKDQLESETAHLRGQLARSKNETERLREQALALQEECKVTRNNARSTQSDLEYRCAGLQKERAALADQLQHFQDAVGELQAQGQRQLEDKRQLSAVLAESQRNLNEAERKNLSLEGRLLELEKLRREENDEWEKFQNDLLTSVRVANDFKTEAQQELQKIILENKTFRERIRHLEGQVEKLNKGHQSSISSKEDAKDMDDLLNFRRRSREKDKHGKSKDSLLSTSTESSKKSDKKSSLSAFVKRREIKPKGRKTLKNLSIEEEILLKTLDDWYENIDKTTPEENLTKEEVAVKRLKTLYEEDALKQKPTAKKPKELLAISKPLLDSVFSNPKLEEIANDPSVPCVEEERDLKFRNSLLDDERPKLSKPKGESHAFDFFRMPKFHKSKSLDDLNTYDEDNNRHSVLYRSPETENLTEEGIVIKKTKIDRFSVTTVLPEDSVSNSRYSDFPKASTNVTYETLDKIIESIPSDPHYILSNEERFALKLKRALDEAERKATLKKLKKKKKMKISGPTFDSVEANAALKEILSNPNFRNVPEVKPIFYIDYEDDQGKRYSYEIPRDFVEEEKRRNGVSRAPSKSVEDISFIFNSVSTSSSKTTNTTTSGEFNVVTGTISSIGNEEILKKFEDTPKRVDSLLYNDTLQKHKGETIEERAIQKSVDKVDSKPTIIVPMQSSIEEIRYDTTNVEESKLEDCCYYREMPDVVPKCEEISVSSDQNEEIKKENKYGVVSPIDVRTTYKNVVKEFKHKFVQGEEKDEETQRREDITEDPSVDDFMDDFFGVTKRDKPETASSSSEDIVRNSENVKQIDKDMQEIMEKYLHTRASLIVRKSAVDSKKDVDKFAQPSNLKKYNNMADLQKICQEDEEERRESIPEICLNDGQKFEAICFEGTKFSGEELRDKCKEFIESEREFNTDADLSDKDLMGVPEEENIETKKKLLEVPMSRDEELEKKFKNLNQEDVKLLDSKKKDRFSRPLSDFNEDDLLMIEEISKRYLNDEEEAGKEKRAENTNQVEPDYIEPNEEQIPKSSLDSNEKELIVKENEATISEGRLPFAKEEIEEMCKNFIENEKKLSNLIDKNIFVENVETKKDLLEGPKFTDEQLEDKFKNLNPEEIKLLKSKKKDRFSRPLSDLNEDDLLMIEEISKRYLDDEEETEIEEGRPENTNQERSHHIKSNEKEVQRSSLDSNEKELIIKENQAAIIIEDRSLFTNEEIEEMCKNFIENEKKLSTLNDKNVLNANVERKIDLVEVPKFTDEQLEEKFKNLNPEEMKLLNSKKKDRFSRPLSDLNEDDLLMIEEISKRYLDEESDEKIEDNPKEELLEREQTTKENKPEFTKEEIKEKCQTFIESEKEFSIVTDSRQLPDDIVKGEDIKTKKDLLEVPKNEGLEERFKHLSEEDINLLNSKRKGRLSDLNVEDLQTIGEISKQYLDDDKKEEIEKQSPKEESESVKKSAIPRLVPFKKEKEKLPMFVRHSGNSSFELSKKRYEERRKVKSWMEGKNATYEPVYANLPFVLTTRKLGPEKINKKPLAIPRYKPEVTTDNDILKMNNENENFREITEIKDVTNMDRSSKVNLEETSRNVEQKIAEILPASSENECVVLEKPEVDSGNVKLTASKSFVEANIEKHETETSVESAKKKAKKKKDEASAEETTNPFEDVEHKKDSFDTTTKDLSHDSLLGDAASGTSQNMSSYSSIAVSGKFEQLDLTKQAQSLPDYLEDHAIEDIQRDSDEASTVNLFELEVAAQEDSYLDLFKTKEQDVYDNLTNKKKPIIGGGIFGIAYLGEISDDDTDEPKYEESLDTSRPKIVDFVPLDDQTEPVFNKELKKESQTDFDTIEREKTFQVLNVASKIKEEPEKLVENDGNIADKGDSNEKLVGKEDSKEKLKDKDESKSSLELLAKKSSFTSTSKSSSSRTSFSQAKKIFEALVEANTADVVKVKSKTSREDMKRKDKEK